MSRETFRAVVLTAIVAFALSGASLFAQGRVRDDSYAEGYRDGRWCEQTETVQRLAFAASAREHGITWSQPIKPLSACGDGSRP